MPRSCASVHQQALLGSTPAVRTVGLAGRAGDTLQEQHRLARQLRAAFEQAAVAGVAWLYCSDRVGDRLARAGQASVLICRQSGQSRRQRLSIQELQTTALRALE